MHHYSVTLPTAVAVLASAMLAAAAAVSAATSNTGNDLNFVESVYARLSNACRAIMDLRYNSMSDSSTLIKTIKIIQLDGDITRTFPINAAFVGLTRPPIFDITKQTKIIIHGYRDSSHSAVPFALARAYNDKRLFNVFLVDANEIYSDGYILAVHNSRLVGKRLANLLANLENFGAHAEDFHLLGISLGAHVAGWAGKYFHRYKEHSLGRITGLDPAGPCFAYTHSNHRLDRSDAKYVDVIHSNQLVQGLTEAVGDADFFINGGGPTQPGCIMPSCSHLRAAQVYTESIIAPKSFIGIRCKNWAAFLGDACEQGNYTVLGYGSSSASRGQYYLRTAPFSPFGLGMNGTKHEKANEYSWLSKITLSD